MNTKDQAYVATQLSLALQHQYPIDQALMLLANRSKQPIKKKLTRIHQKLHCGFLLGQATADLFDPILSTMINLGEKTQQLPLCLSQAATLMQARTRQQKANHKALWLPCINLLVSILIGLSLTLIMTPQLVAFWQELSQSQMPQALQQLVFIEAWLSHYGVQSLISLFLLGALIRYTLKKHPKRLLPFKRLAIATPPLKRLLGLGHYLLWLRTLDHLQQSVITLPQSIMIANDLFKQTAISYELNQFSQSLAKGYSMQSCCKQTTIMPYEVQEALLTMAQHQDACNFAIKALETRIQHDQDLITHCLPPLLMLLNAAMILWMMQMFYQPMTQLGESLLIT